MEASILGAAEIFGSLAEERKDMGLISPGNGPPNGCKVVCLDELPPSSGGVICGAEAVDLQPPLDNATLFFISDGRSYKAVLGALMEEGSDLGYMRTKLLNRLGDAWSPKGNIRDARGFYLDQDDDPVVAITRVDSRRVEYRIALGDYGTREFLLDDMNGFSSNVGVIERVASAFFDSCYAGQARNRRFRLPGTIYFRCEPYSGVDERGIMGDFGEED